MGMYMYPIEIKREPQIVKYQKEITIYGGKFTIDIITKHVSKDEYFYVFPQDGNLCSSDCLLEIHGRRLETKTETTKRVQKEEKYMENYTKFHANKKK